VVTIRNHNLILDNEFTRELNSKIIYELGKNCPENQLKFKELYNSRKKSLMIAFICLMFFPGTHYAFMGKWQLQLLFWITLGGGLIWWVTDIFRLSKIVKENNVEYQNQILREINSENIFSTFKPMRIHGIADMKVA